MLNVIVIHVITGAEDDNTIAENLDVFLCGTCVQRFATVREHLLHHCQGEPCRKNHSHTYVLGYNLRKLQL